MITAAGRISLGRLDTSKEWAINCWRSVRLSINVANLAISRAFNFAICVAKINDRERAGGWNAFRTKYRTSPRYISEPCSPFTTRQSSSLLTLIKFVVLLPSARFPTKTPTGGRGKHVSPKTLCTKRAWSHGAARSLKRRKVARLACPVAWDQYRGRTQVFLSFFSLFVRCF